MRGKYRWGQKVIRNYNIDIDKLKDKLYNYIYNR